jgi:hypothetical protein
VLPMIDPLGGREEQVRVGFHVADLVAGDASM